jgi:hypothetical protein
MAFGNGDSVATSKPKINAYINKEINQAIDREAGKEWRSKSQMIELLLKEALEARGYRFEFGQDEMDEQGA